MIEPDPRYIFDEYHGLDLNSRKLLRHMDEVMASGTQRTQVTLPEEDEQCDSLSHQDPLHGIGTMLGLSLDESIIHREGRNQNEQREQEETDRPDCDG